MKYKCLIIDDEKLGRELIKSYLSQFPYLEIEAECNSAIDALQLIKDHHIDIMFLDINMPQLTGIELLRQHKKLPLTILCTAYSEYALESFELDVVDYLLKPIDNQRFKKAISKVMNRLNPNIDNSDHIIDKKVKNFFFVKSDYKDIKIVISEIKYIEAMEKYVRIYTTSQKTMTLMSMSSIMEFLPLNQFFRIHRSFIINKNKIDLIEGNTVQIDQKKLPISKGNRKMIKHLLN
jgi:DNA-binding LytR/AlgR family response regulator